MAEINIPFVENKDGTITDKTTGLIWQQSPDREAAMSWDQAGDYVRKLNTGDRHEWRLPTKQELHNLTLSGGENPSQWLCDHGFEELEWGFYWTNTKHDKKPDHYWYVDMGTGEMGIHPKDNLYFVLAVCSSDTK